MPVLQVEMKVNENTQDSTNKKKEVHSSFLNALTDHIWEHYENNNNNQYFLKYDFVCKFLSICNLLLECSILLINILYNVLLYVFSCYKSYMFFLIFLSKVRVIM